MKAILASQNRNKIKEINAILEKFDMEAVPRDDTNLPKDDIEENGTTFEDNSLAKAQGIKDMIVSGGYEEYMDCPIIADDTGLMVDALDGAPGVYSARYAGEGRSATDNNDKLLSELKDIPFEERTACFATVITMIFPDGKKIVARGECPGYIAEDYKGSGGFGYDSLFIPEGYDETFAELGADVKNSISHRRRALEKLEEILNEG